jgi:hypothetical protein
MGTYPNQRYDPADARAIHRELLQGRELWGSVLLSDIHYRIYEAEKSANRPVVNECAMLEGSLKA